MPIHGYPGNVITANPTAPTVNAASGVWTTEQQLIAMAAGNWPMAATQISRSLRFNSADSAYLNRTPASAGNRRTWTWSGWIKRGGLGVTQGFISAGTNGNQIFFAGFSGTDDKIYIHNGVQGVSVESWAVTSAVYRDPSAWYHIVLVVDTTNATAANRVILYVNGVPKT